MPYMVGAYIAVNVTSQILVLLQYFNLKSQFSYVITNNTSKNSACIELLSKELDIDPTKRYVLCISYIINLMAYQVLFRVNIKAFELELKSNVIAKFVKLVTQYYKGPIGKLYNLIYYIMHLSKQRHAFRVIQVLYIESQQELLEDEHKPLKLV